MQATELLKTFMGTMEKQGHATSPVTKQTMTALDKAGQIIAEDSAPPSAEALCNAEIVKAIYTRFMTKFSGELATGSANVYVNRVVKAAENYCRYQKDPLTFQPTFSKAELKGERISETKGRKKSATTGTQQPDSTTTAPILGAQSIGTSGERFATAFPLRKGLTLNFSLPTDLKTDEVKRMAYYLLTLCEDFNPGVTVWPHGGPSSPPSLN